MPRRRLCLGFYVCDLEFGICLVLCLFIYASSLDVERGASFSFFSVRLNDASDDTLAGIRCCNKAGTTGDSYCGHATTPTINVPDRHVEGEVRLGGWLQRQRQRMQARGLSEAERKAKRVSALSDKEVSRLEAVGVVL